MQDLSLALMVPALLCDQLHVWEEREKDIGPAMQAEQSRQRKQAMHVNASLTADCLQNTLTVVVPWQVN